MSNGANTVRVNVSLPGDLLSDLKKTVPPRGISRFLAKAAEEKMERMEKEEALAELLAAPPSFRKIKNASAYIRKLRRLEEKRAKRLRS